MAAPLVLRLVATILAEPERRGRDRGPARDIPPALVESIADAPRPEPVSPGLPENDSLGLGPATAFSDKA